MKAMLITPKNEDEFKFLTELLEKLGINSSALNDEELEDLALSTLMQEADITEKVSRAEIMNKLKN